MALLEPDRDRRRPYTERGIVRLRCSVPWCHRRAAFQWNVCASGGVYRAVCAFHDVSLNDLVLAWADEPDRDTLMGAYARALQVDLDAVRAEEARRQVAVSDGQRRSPAGLPFREGSKVE